MNYVDSHSHLYLDEFNDDLPQVIARAQAAGVSQVLLPNIDSTTTQAMLRVAHAYPQYCYPMMGLHPTSVNAATYKDELQMVEQELARTDEYIGVGEIGLDLYWDKTYLNEQIHAFDHQLRLALQYGLPVVIHSRDAFAPLYETMLPYKDTALKGVFHSFTGTAHEAARLLEFENFCLGINGVVTFKNSALWQVLKEVPMERLLLETDAPYLTPVPYRGRRNESAHLQYTLGRVAQIYTQPAEKLAEVTRQNTLRLFDRLKW